MTNPGRVVGAQRGAALMVALFLTTLLFVLGVALLYFLDQDSRFGLNMQRSQQAHSLAKSGILFAIYEEYNSQPTGMAMMPTTYTYWTDATQTLGFRVWKENDAGKTLKASGLVRDASGRTLATRVFAVESVPSGLPFPASLRTMQARYWDYDL
jgi:hypothetical protein